MQQKVLSVILAIAVVVCMPLTVLAEEAIPTEPVPVPTESTPTEPAATETEPTVSPTTEPQTEPTVPPTTEPQTNPTVPATEPAAALEIDTEHIYEGMGRAYEAGYIPEIKDGTVRIFLPLKSTGELRDSQIKAALDLGTGETPFVVANYEKRFPLQTVLPLNSRQEQQLYLVSFGVKLSKDRINGTYPVTVRVSASDAAGTPVSFVYTVFVTVTDGKSGEPEIPAVPEPEKPTAEPVVFLAAARLEPEVAMAGEPFTLTLTLQNSLTAKSVENLLVTVDPGSLQINLLENSNVIPVRHIAAGGDITLVLHFDTDPSIPAQKHKINFHFQYDSSKTLGLSSEGSYILDVRQGAELEFDGAVLPVKVFQDETVTVSLNLMNTGKSPLYNCRIGYEIEGLASGGTTFVGEIPAGENKVGTGNLRVGREQLGDVSGTVTITYEDAFGQEYTKQADVSTHIAEKPAPEPAEEAKTPRKNGPWWLFGLLGLGVGGGLGFGIPWLMKDRRQRREDDLRL